MSDRNSCLSCFTAIVILLCLCCFCVGILPLGSLILGKHFPEHIVSQISLSFYIAVMVAIATPIIFLLWVFRDKLNQKLAKIPDKYAYLFLLAIYLFAYIASLVFGCEQEFRVSILIAGLIFTFTLIMITGKVEKGTLVEAGLAIVLGLVGLGQLSPSGGDQSPSLAAFIEAGYVFLVLILFLFFIFKDISGGSPEHGNDQTVNSPESSVVTKSKVIKRNVRKRNYRKNLRP